MEVNFIYINYGLLQRNEAGGVGGSNTRTTVLNRLVCNGEFSKVVTNHLRLQEKYKTMTLKSVVYISNKTLGMNTTCPNGTELNQAVGYRENILQ